VAEGTGIKDSRIEYPELNLSVIHARMETIVGMPNVIIPEEWLFFR
jgi:hypothetical protein